MDSEPTSTTCTTQCIVGGAVAAIAVLGAAKKYFDGGTCTVNRNIEGLTVVLTGGNTGIGKETIEVLASKKCKIIFGARDTKKSEKAIADIKSRVKDADISQYSLDLASKASVKDFADHVLGQVEKIDILVNNAAVMLIPTRQFTEDGFQMQMGVNHFGHFYLTSLLWPKIKIANHPRIVVVSSMAHQGMGLSPKNQPIDFQDIHYAQNYDGGLSYTRSKAANILFTKELQRKMDQAKIDGRAVCLHPGAVRTELTRNLSFGLKLVEYAFLPIKYLMFKSARQGAQTSLYAVLEDQEKLVKGGYYSDCKLKASSAFTSEPQNAVRLWQISEKELAIKFNV